MFQRIPFNSIKGYFNYYKDYSILEFPDEDVVMKYLARKKYGHKHPFLKNIVKVYSPYAIFIPIKKIEKNNLWNTKLNINSNKNLTNINMCAIFDINNKPLEQDNIYIYKFQDEIHSIDIFYYKIKMNNKVKIKELNKFNQKYFSKETSQTIFKNDVILLYNKALFYFNNYENWLDEQIKKCFIDFINNEKQIKKINLDNKLKDHLKNLLELNEKQIFSYGKNFDENEQKIISKARTMIGLLYYRHSEDSQHFKIQETLQKKLRNIARMIKFSNIKEGVLFDIDQYYEDFSCSLNDFKKHFEELFKEGMDWGNYGEWHIDHIKPCIFFDLNENGQQKLCFNIKNLQPLWAIENKEKGITFKPDDFENIYNYLKILYENNNNKEI